MPLTTWPLQAASVQPAVRQPGVESGSEAGRFCQKPAVLVSGCQARLAWCRGEDRRGLVCACHPSGQLRGRGRGSWGETGTVGCPAKSCLSGSEMCSIPGWNGDMGRETDQLGCGSQSALVYPVQTAVCPVAPALLDPRVVLLSSQRNIAFLCYTLSACFCSLLDVCFMLAPQQPRSGWKVCYQIQREHFISQLDLDLLNI